MVNFLTSEQCKADIVPTIVIMGIFLYLFFHFDKLIHSTQCQKRLAECLCLHLDLIIQ
jgi:hypothetical protein